MEIDKFNGLTVVFTSKDKECVELLLKDELRCYLCGNRRFIVKTITKSDVSMISGNVPIICEEIDKHISITKVLITSNNKNCIGI